MHTHSDELLRPTLAANGPLAAPYSVQATYFTGFFGGPFAALGIILANSVRLERLRRDTPVLCVLLLLAIAYPLWLTAPTAGQAAREWLAGHVGAGYLRFLTRFAGLAFAGVGYVLHRPEQRAATLMGLERPNGWKMGLGCIVGATLVMTLLVLLNGAGGVR